MQAATHYKFSPSRQQRFVLMSVYFAVSGLLLLTLQPWFCLVGIGIAGMGLWRISLATLPAIFYAPTAQWFVEDWVRGKQAVVLQGDSFVSRFCMILHFQSILCKGSYRLVLFPDTLTPQEWRWLTVQLRS